MIAELTIQNFQSHRDTHLNFLSGVNAFVGDSDSGKSGAFRAIELLFTNKPSGDEFRSHWGGDTHVAVKLIPEDIWVGRVKGASKNYYYIGDDISKNRLEGFGQGVPKEVVKVLNISTVNFQSQMSEPFLLGKSSSAGKVGRFLNEAADLSVIDRSVSGIASVLRKEKADFDSFCAEANRLIESLKTFEWIDEADNELKNLEALEDDVFDLEDDIKWIDQQICLIQETDKQLAGAGQILLFADQIEALCDLDKTIGKEGKEIFQHEQLITHIEDLDFRLIKAEVITGAEPLLLKLLALQEGIRTLSSEITYLSLTVAKVEMVFIDENRMVIERDKLEKTFHEMMPDQCPLCGK